MFSMRSTLSLQMTVDEVLRHIWPVRGSYFVIQPYTIINGTPVDVTDLTVVAGSDVVLGSGTGSSYPEMPNTVGHDVVARWAGGTADFAAGVWSVREGDETMSFRTSAGAPSPTPWDGYRYSMGHGAAVAPAVVFTGKEWMSLTTPGPWASSSITVAMVAVLRAGIGASYRILSTPERSSADSTNAARFLLDFDHGTLRLYLRDISAVQHEIPYDGRPIGIVLRAETGMVSLTALRGQTLATNTVPLAARSVLIDANFQLGRGVTASDSSTLAVMGLFDLAIWDRVLPDEEVRSVLDIYDSGYGLTR
jgi:hypothetical protein